MKINVIHSYQNSDIKLNKAYISKPKINNVCDVFEPSFKGHSKLEIAQNALDKLREKQEKGQKLNQSDEIWLKPLRKVLGTESFTVNNPDNPKETISINSSLTTDKINETGGIEALSNALTTMIAATKYKPETVKVGGVKYSVHNETISKLLKGEYDKESFSQLMKYLNGKKVFDFTDNPRYGLLIDKQRGIVKTCGASENWEMSDRAWITDIMRVGDIQKFKRPETWTTALNTIGEYYHTQNENFKDLIANPDLYRNGDAMQGIPHIFMPKTLEPDVNWFNNKRLESHGLALKEFCNGIVDGLVRGRKYGYKSADEIPENVIESIGNLTKYFKAIDYPTAPSAGNWEEIPLKGGLTSDTETIRSAYCAYKNLMFNPKFNNNHEIQKVRARINCYNPVNENETTKLIKQGEQRVRKTYLEEAPSIRPHDASLAFVTTSDIKLADNVIDDVKKHVEILESLEKHLVRENGIIRYAPFKFVLKDGSEAKSPDSYLNLNYFTAVDKNGKLNLEWKKVLDNFASKDCSDPEMFFARAKLSTPDKEAQWFMVSEMSTGYGKQIEKLLDNVKKENRKLNPTEIKLVKKLREKQTEYLNRALSRISAENPDRVYQYKANGLSMSPVTVSEAHQYVTDLNGKPKMMQGTNTPLAWALASLYKALRQEYKIIEKL
ncbi:hypothetical protein IJS77_02760 [bacterium]|nr:hypothetical protein [bacterium]